MILAPGQLLDGRFRIDALLGKGGFGAVYRATDLELERVVAVKVLLPQAFMRPGGQARFRREAELAQRLGHPNTVRLYAFGQGPHGAPYTVWELLEGKPLDAILRETPRLPTARVARIGSQVLKSLGEAHAMGIVHRDIKPANLFVCQFAGEPDFVKVLDFGIAAGADAESEGGAPLTQTGQTMGTPSYMAPEQVEHAKTVDGRADLYALGLVLAEAIAGRVIMQGPSGMRICIDQMSEAPVPLPPEVLQAPLGPVIARACQKRPEHRYADAPQMLRDLERHASVGPTTRPPRAAPPAFAPPPPTPLVLMQPSTPPASVLRDPRAGWVVAGVLALCLIGGLGYFVATGSASGERSGRQASSRDEENDEAKPPKRDKKTPREDEPSAEERRPRPTTGPATSVRAAVPIEDFSAKGRSAQQLLDALAERGYQAQEVPRVQATPQYSSFHYVFTSTEKEETGALMFFRYRSAEEAKALEETLSADVALHREGGDVVGVDVHNGARSKKLLDELLSK
jgi:serine/threonine protein kinase